MSIVFLYRAFLAGQITVVSVVLDGWGYWEGLCASEMFLVAWELVKDDVAGSSSERISYLVFFLIWFKCKTTFREKGPEHGLRVIVQSN